MAKPSETNSKQTEEAPQEGSTKYDRLERLANAATQAAEARQWQARKNGMANQGEPAEVRDLSQDAEAKAQAEAAMQAMMAKSGGKPRRR
jgi:hypothetical protein